MRIRGGSCQGEKSEKRGERGTYRLSYSPSPNRSARPDRTSQLAISVLKLPGTFSASSPATPPVRPSGLRAQTHCFAKMASSMAPPHVDGRVIKSMYSSLGRLYAAGSALA